MLYEQQAQILFNAYKEEVEPLHYNTPLTELASSRAILQAEPQVQIALLRIILWLPLQQLRTSHNYYDYKIYRLETELCKRKLPYTADDINDLLRALSSIELPYYVSYRALLSSMTQSLDSDEILQACRAELERLQEIVRTRWPRYADQHKFFKQLDDIINQRSEDSLKIRSDSWGTPLAASLEKMDDPLRTLWAALLLHCARATGKVPSKAWLAARQPLIEELGVQNFRHLAMQWIGAFRAPKEERLDEENTDLLKGLAWCCSGIEDAALASVLADAAIEGYRKIPGLGPGAVKVATACVFSLKNMPIQYGAAQLERVRQGVKQPSFLKAIEATLNEMATNANMSRADLEELTVPTFGLQQGKLRIPIGSAVAQLEINGLQVDIRWLDADDKPLKKEPAEVKRHHKAELKDLKHLSDDIARMLRAQRDRLERLPLSERQWSLPEWRERYLEHPLVGHLAQRLLWRFNTGDQTISAIWLDGQLVDATDHPLSLPESTQVSAWHAVLCSPAEILQWRNWLERHQITQPFKQAHREVYLLTDAERTTRVYSNRFAAHILRQHQFNALAAERRWQNQLRLMVDDSYPPATFELPHWNLRAEFWIEGAGETYGEDTNEAGTYLRVATDQVRFYPINTARNLAHAGGGGYGFSAGYASTPEPLPLEQIPPLVFSEVMRDVDLFVGVASIGNDPTWVDGGPDGRYQGYWHRYSFGKLSATAETRQQLLNRLVPRLAIANRCSIDGRYLKVRGDLRTYKIHLGSSNILMEPNDQYLCIVPNRGQNTATTDIFLPFEGDTVLSIILSKAFLLAEDSKITDASITRQIRNQ